MDEEIPVNGEIPQLLERLRTPASRRASRQRPQYEFSHWHDFEECWRKLHDGQAHDQTVRPRPMYTPPSAFIGSDIGEWLKLQNTSPSPKKEYSPSRRTSPGGRPSPQAHRARSPPLSSSPDSWEVRSAHLRALDDDTQGKLPTEAFRHEGGRWHTEIREPKALLSHQSAEERGIPPPMRMKIKKQGKEPPPSIPEESLAAADCNFKVKPRFNVQVTRHKAAEPGRSPMQYSAASLEGEKTVEVCLPPSKQRVIPAVLLNPLRKQKRGVQNRAGSRGSINGEMGRGAKRDRRAVTHLLDFGGTSQDHAPAPGYVHRRLGEGPRLNPLKPKDSGSNDGITVNLGKGRARSRGGEEVLVVQYSGLRPETREVDRILRRVVPPPSMLTCKPDSF